MRRSPNPIPPTVSVPRSRDDRPGERDPAVVAPVLVRAPIPPLKIPRPGLRGRIWILVALSVAALAAAVSLLDAWLDKPLRAWAEKAMNAQLEGYTVELGGLDIHPWRLTLELDDLSVVQDAHPETPVATVEALRFSISWRALVHLRLLGVLDIDRPRLRIDLPQLQEEARSETRLKDKGWQGAVRAIYPLKLEEVLIHDGSLSYLSATPDAKPIQMSRIEFTARDIRNVRSIAGTYPSPVHLDASLFETGRIRFDGAADFLAEPAAALKGELRVDRVPLDRLGSEAVAVQLRMNGGFLSANGSLESMPESTAVLLKEVRLEDWKADFVTSPATQEAEKRHAVAVSKAAKKADNAPGMLLRIDRLRIVDSEFGFVNRSTDPSYRLFLSDFDLELDNLSNQSHEGEVRFRATGDFMGSGKTRFHGAYRPGMEAARFDVHLEMQDTRLASLNDLLRAYAGFDVSEGRFSLYTEIDVRDHRISGMVKPMIRDVQVYERKQDRNRSLAGKTWQILVDAAAHLLRNRDRKEVATEFRIRGVADDPEVSNFRVIAALIGNGFLHDIRPGLPKSTKPVGAKKAAPAPKRKDQGGKTTP